MMPKDFSNSIFWINIDKIKINPFQPRKEFDEIKIKELAESIRQYGLLQPIIVSRIENENPDGLVVEYELISGERRWRAAKIAGLKEIPAIIKNDISPQLKLELAIIENIQREDLNVVEKARAFLRLIDEFGFTHTQIASKIGKSREYVTNTLRILSLPQEVIEAIINKEINEGHARPLLMLAEYKEEQNVLFKEIIFKKLNVREAEQIAKRIIISKSKRKYQENNDPQVLNIEKELQKIFGTRVKIEKKEIGGYIKIDFFSDEDLNEILKNLNQSQNKKNLTENENEEKNSNKEVSKIEIEFEEKNDFEQNSNNNSSNDEDLYNINNFSI